VKLRAKKGVKIPNYLKSTESLSRLSVDVEARLIIDP